MLLFVVGTRSPQDGIRGADGTIFSIRATLLARLRSYLVVLPNYKEVFA